MASVLRQTGDEPVTISAKDLRLLLDRSDGDAALLYLALKRRRGQEGGRPLAEELRWNRTRLEAAEQVLRELELVIPAAAELPEEPEGRPVYQEADIAACLEGDTDFRALTAQVEQKLGKKLSIADLERLLGLYERLDLSPDVIYTLVGHCVERHAKRHGAGRIPTMRQIEKEGYAWARRGTDTQPAAEAYLKRYASRDQEFAAYMRALRLGDRLPVASEEKYFAQWQEWGFPAETVALAYERTIFRCHEFKWNYCGGILRRWHQSGMHTAAEVKIGDRAGGKRAAFSDASEDARFQAYAEELRAAETPLVSPEDAPFQAYAEELRADGARGLPNNRADTGANGSGIR